MFFHVWGHAITDNIRRVWFLKSDSYKREFKSCPVVYISLNDINLESQQNFRRLLEILEVDVDRLQEIKQPTQFNKIIIPDEAFLRNFTNEYRETINIAREFAKKNRTPVSSKKIYYFHGRYNHIGEEYLAEYFKSKGYLIVRPEKLTLDEQLNLLINCESFASTVGSCAHNCMFLRDGTETILIPRRNFASFYQEPINQVNPLNVSYVDSSLSIFGRGISLAVPCYIVSKQLKEFFGDKFDGYEEEDFKIFMKYVTASLSKELNINQRAKEYYEPILQDFMAQLKQREDLITAYNMPPRWETFRPILTYQTHIKNNGWREGWKIENQISNPIDQKRDVQAIKVNFPGHKVWYSVYYNEEEGWSEEVLSPEMAGTTGKSKAIYGIKIRLDETGQKASDILYRMHKFDDTWTPWAKNGETLYSYGQKLNAIQIKLEPKT